MLQGHKARMVRAGDTPTISVLLTSTGKRSELEAALAQLLPTCEKLEAEVIVARAYNDAELAEMRAAFPAVYFAAAPAGSTVHELRAIGMAGTDSDIIVLGEADEITTEDLIDRFVQSRRNEKAGYTLSMKDPKASHDRA